MTFNPKFLNTSVVPPPQPDDHCIKILQKSIKAYLRSCILWFWTYRQIHACHKLNSLFPPLPYPLLNFDAGATTVTTYLIENYTFYRKTCISHLPYTLHHYFKILSNHMNFMNLGVLNLFTLHHCFFKTIGYRADIHINPGTDHMWDTYINLTLWLQF